MLFDTVVQLLQDTLCLDHGSLAGYFQLTALESMAADESVSVRRAALGSLALLLRTCPLRQVCELWARGVLPLVMDREASVVERALDELRAAVLDDVAARAEGGAEEQPASLPPVLSHMDSEAMEYLQRGLRLIALRDGGKPPLRLIKALTSIVRDCLRRRPVTQWPLPVWSMLEESSRTLGASTSSTSSSSWIRGPGAARPGGAPGGAAVWQAPAGCPASPARWVWPSGWRASSSRPSARRPQKERQLELMESLCAALSSLSAPPPII
ncbi:unnamed protein product, partial [Prorocentrum cordatum]